MTSGYDKKWATDQYIAGYNKADDDWNERIRKAIEEFEKDTRTLDTWAWEKFTKALLKEDSNKF